MRTNIIGHFLDDYYGALIESITIMEQKELDAVEKILFQAKKLKSTVYLMGNGGSAATCDHLCNDFIKMAGLKTVSLVNVSVITAYANDESYDNIFEKQLKVLMKPNDVVIAFSGSGNSRNIVKALEYANKNGATTIAFLGFDGGAAKNIAKSYIHIKSDNYGIIEDLHLSLGHYFNMKLCKNLNMVDIIEFLKESNYIEDEFGERAEEDAIRAWDWALNNYKRKINAQYVLGVHKQLMQHLNYRIAGKFRNCSVFVGGHEAVEYTKIKELIKEWCNNSWAVKTEKDIKEAHITFEHIHPFEDGNGRTGRILMNIQRANAGLPIHIIHTGKEQTDYYKWFRKG